MAAKEKELTITLEGELDNGAGRPPLKLTMAARFEPSSGEDISPEDIRKATERLRSMISEALSVVPAAESTVSGVPGFTEANSAAPRSIEVLRQVYTPRSLEHLDDLLWERQITRAEHELLVADLKPGSRLSTVARPKETSAPTPPRSVEELIREFELRDIRDANRARGKELISYEEWSLLKKHYTKA